MKKHGLFLGVVLGLLACGEGPHPGYSELRPGLWYRLNTLGDGPSLKQGPDLLRLRLRAARLGEPPGSLFSTERDYHPSDLHTSGLEDVLDRCQEGDSVSVIAAAAGIAWQRIAPEVTADFPDTGLVAIELRISEGPEVEALPTPSLHPVKEQHLLDSLVAADPHWTRWGTSRLHYQVLDSGTDKLPISRGHGVTITYTGSLPDGRIIDGLRERGGELTFLFGDPDQVVEGMEVAVSLLHEGGRGRFLIPSELGFGSAGSSAGLVPPNTPLLYEVEVLRVDRGPVARP